MNKYKFISAAVLAFALMSTVSCIKDLDVKPIDPSMQTQDKALATEQSYKAFLATTYAGFATSGYKGPDSDPSISGLDGGASQYIRGLYHLNGLTTDEALCGWNDQTIKDFHYMTWTTTDTFIYAFYSRIFHQIGLFNEFIRQARDCGIDSSEIQTYIAEARALRAYCYLHAIDNFGSVPFSDENTPIGTNCAQISRADLFAWMETELKDIINDSAIKAARTNEYGRVDKAFAQMVLAKLYLNAEVYTGQPRYQECADVCAELERAGYSLHPNFAELFMADNDKCTDEIIFAIQQDGVNIKSYGVTNYLIFASTGGSMETTEKGAGISSGWGGIRTTPQFFDLFTDNDSRRLFETANGQIKENTDIGDFTNGYAFVKFRNVRSDGTVPNTTVDKDGNLVMPGFVDTDFPVFRYSDVLLMEAECAKRGASVPNAQAAWDAVRARAGISGGSYTLEDVLDERGREFVQECWRRQDLIRFGKFTGSEYVWSWKGGILEGQGTESFRNLFPIPTADLNANANLKQNPGY